VNKAYRLAEGNICTHWTNQIFNNTQCHNPACR